MNEHRRRTLFSVQNLVIAGALVVAAVLILGMVLVVGLARDVKQANERTDRAEVRTEKAETVSAELLAKVDALTKQIEGLGEEPVVDPGPVEPPPATGLSEEHVRAIVAEELLTHDAELTDAQIANVARVAAAQIPKPRDGTTPTEAQVRAVVVDVVAGVCANDACRGEDGDDGEDGQDAPPVTD